MRGVPPFSTAVTPTASLKAAVKATRNADQGLASGSVVTLTWNTEAFDRGTPSTDMHDTATNSDRLYARYDGLYVVQAQVAWPGAAGASQRRLLAIDDNTGSELARDDANAVASLPHVSKASAPVVLTAGQYVTAVALHNSTGTVNVDHALSFFALWMIGP